jgi:anti-anti-sigma factor
VAELDGDSGAAASIDTRTDSQGATVLVVAGDVDISNAQTLQRAVDAALEDRPALLVFDLSGLRFIDSAGLAVLLGAAQTVEKVQLRDPSPAVRRVVELTGLTGVLPTQS